MISAVNTPEGAETVADGAVPLTPPPSTGGLGVRARAAVVWNTGFNVFRDVLQFGVMLVLVRIISPESYGQFGLVTASIGFASVLSHRSCLAHTVQVRREGEVHYQDHFTAGGVIQIALFALTNLVAAGLYFVARYSAVAPLIQISSLTFLLDWPSDLRLKMLEREMDWRRFRTIHAAGLVASSLLSLGMALAGAGVYALIAPPIIIPALFAIDLFYGVRWRPRWSWSWDNYAPAVRFGLTRTLSDLVSRARPLMETNLVVAAVGFASLGMLGRAVGLGTLISQRVAFQLMYSVYPALAKIETRTDAYRRVSALLFRLIAWVVIPGTTLVIVLSDVIVRTLYGSRWLAVIPLLPWATGSAAVGALAYVVNTLLLAHERAGWSALLDVVLFLGVALALVLALPFGLERYLIGLVTAQAVALSIGLMLLCWDRAFTPGAVVTGVAPALVAALVGFGACALVEWLFDWTVRSAAEAFAYSVVFGAGYAVTLRVCCSGPLAELVRYLPLSRLFHRAFFLRPV